MDRLATMVIKWESTYIRPAIVSALAVWLVGCGVNGVPTDDVLVERSMLVENSKPAIRNITHEKAVSANGLSQRQVERIPVSIGRKITSPLNTDGNVSDQDQISLNFPGAEVNAVISALARFTGRNFVVDPRVKGQLSLISEVPVSAETAYSMLLSALRMQGFAVVEVGGVSRVVPEADAKTQGGPVAVTGESIARPGELITRVFALRYESAENLVPVLRPMIAPNNSITAYAGSNTLVITDYSDNLERIASVIAGVDLPTAFNTNVIPIEYGVALDVAAIATQLLDAQARDQNERVTVVADPRSNTVLVSARSPERLEFANSLIERIDSPKMHAGNLHVVNLRNAQATNMAEVLRGALSGAGGSNVPENASLAGGGSSTSRAQAQGVRSTTGRSAEPLGAITSFSAGGATVQADPATNTLLITAPDPLYRSLREVIDLLDQRRAQVLIEGLIVEVNVENVAEFGVQWMVGGGDIDSGKSSFIGGTNLSGSGFSSTGTTTIDVLAQGLNLGVVDGTVDFLGKQILNLGVLARALHKQSGSNVLSTPNLMTMDNEEASIIVGRTVPFVTGRYTTSGDGTSNPFQTVEREDVGLTLRVRPQISEGGTVKLSLYQEVSSIDPSASASSMSLVTRKRALETNVLVDDGQIIVLGGLLEDSRDTITAEVPYLGKIPILGRLFRYDIDNRVRTNLMVFLRPHIVRSTEDAASLTLDRYSYMRTSQTRLTRESMSKLLPDISVSSGVHDLRETKVVGKSIEILSNDAVPKRSHEDE